MKNKISKELGSGFIVRETDSKREYVVDRGLAYADIDDIIIKEASKKTRLASLKI